MRLYDIASAYRSLQDQLDAAETPEEMKETLRDTLESLSGDFEEKAENMAALIAENTATVEGCKAEIDRLSQKAARLQAQNDSIKKYLMAEMQYTGQRKLQAGTWQISIARNGGKAPILWADRIDLQEVPEQFIKTTQAIDSAAVRAALEAGTALSFAELGERGESLRIK